LNISCLVGDAGVVADPVQVSGDAAEDGGSTRLAASGGSEGGHSDQAVAVVCNQGATRVASAGGLASVSVDADHVVVERPGAAAITLGNDLDIDGLEPVGQWAAIVGAAPSGGHGPPSGVVLVAVVVAGQLNLVDQAPEVDVRGTDQGDVVVQVAAVVVVVLDDVATAHPVGVLGLGADAGSVVDGHSTGSVGAVSGGQDPGVADDRATAPPVSVAAEEQTHDVGHLALVGWVAVGDATLNVLDGRRGQLLGGSGHSSSCGHGQGQEYEQFHLGQVLQLNGVPMSKRLYIQKKSLVLS